MAHVIGSSRRSQRVGWLTWRMFWELETGEEFPDTCQMYSCENPSDLGAHVYIRGRGCQNYIMPCCQRCNQNRTLHFQGQDNPNWSQPKDQAIVVATPTPHIVLEVDDRVAYLPCSSKGKGSWSWIRILKQNPMHEWPGLR